MKRSSKPKAKGTAIKKMSPRTEDAVANKRHHAKGTQARSGDNNSRTATTPSAVSQTKPESPAQEGPCTTSAEWETKRDCPREEGAQQEPVSKRAFSDTRVSITFAEKADSETRDQYHEEKEGNQQRPGLQHSGDRGNIPEQQNDSEENEERVARQKILKYSYVSGK